MSNIDHFRSLLLKQRQDLLDIATSGAQGAETVELDQTRVGRVSRMDALQQQAMSQEAMRRRQIAMQNINDALARIESGDYGYCADCGDEIARGRLEIDPAGTLCVNCARKREA
ncbi:TraR/DksA family transcriptional regulator [Pseudomonadota bacterium]